MRASLESWSRRLLRGLARRDPSDRAKRWLLLGSALHKYAAGQTAAGDRYLEYLGFHHRGGKGSSLRPYDDCSYYEVLEDTNYAAYLQSNVSLVSHAAPHKDVSICDIGCGRGHFLAALETAGFANCTGYEISGAAVREAVHSRVHRIGSLSDIQGKFDIVTLVSVLEHIPSDVLPAFAEGVTGLTREFVVACLPIYPNNMLDFFDHDPTHVTLERREWWDQLWERQGFQRQAPPNEPLPFVGPFIYRKADLG